MPPLPLPDNISPDSIDTLTELNTVLARFRSSLPTNPLSASHPNLANLAGLGPLPGGGGTGTTPAATSTPLPGSAVGAAAGTGGVLDFKDLPAATDNLKHKLRRAREAVKTLPDLERDLAAQEKEMALLEEKKGMQIAELLRIKEEGERFAKAEQNKPDEGEKMMT